MPNPNSSELNKEVLDHLLAQLDDIRKDQPEDLKKYNDSSMENQIAVNLACRAAKKEENPLFETQEPTEKAMLLTRSILDPSILFKDALAYMTDKAREYIQNTLKVTTGLHGANVPDEYCYDETARYYSDENVRKKFLDSKKPSVPKTKKGKKDKKEKIQTVQPFHKVESKKAENPETADAKTQNKKASTPKPAKPAATQPSFEQICLW